MGDWQRPLGTQQAATTRYQYNGSKQSFTALVHVEQTGPLAVISGVVTDGCGKGNLLKGEYTEVRCEHDGVATYCWQGTVDNGE